ncbi:hypothetical protein [Microcoleus sp. D2_18a_B4]|uniref:hypothetical protein n=1 Tax=Microcoleus sp. D2_18a_B4 TaxID=3055329 RepID=UPI002FD45A1B
MTKIIKYVLASGRSPAASQQHKPVGIFGGYAQTFFGFLFKSNSESHKLYKYNRGRIRISSVIYIPQSLTSKNLL